VAAALQSVDVRLSQEYKPRTLWAGLAGEVKAVDGDVPGRRRGSQVTQRTLASRTSMSHGATKASSMPKQRYKRRALCVKENGS
jgi:hypothetical protein